MAEDLSSGPVIAASPFAAATTEDLLEGSRLLRHAFLQAPVHYADRGSVLVRRGDASPTILLLRSGFAYRSRVLSDGRRAILDLLISGDIIGLDHVVVAHPLDDFIAACRLGYNILDPSECRRLMREERIALRIYTMLVEARWRADRLTVSIGRLDAQARICLMLLDIHDRMRRRGVLNRPTFNLPLTQEQIADHLGLTVVHVNRTLRRLREDRIVMLDRQVVIILDLDRLREITQDLPRPADMLEPAEDFSSVSLD